jgi:hypothetical protein
VEEHQFTLGLLGQPSGGPRKQLKMSLEFRHRSVLRVRKTWVETPVLPHTVCVRSCDYWYLSLTQFPRLSSGDENRIYIWGGEEVMHEECLAV